MESGFFPPSSLLIQEALALLTLIHFEEARNGLFEKVHILFGLRIVESSSFQEFFSPVVSPSGGFSVIC